MSVEIPCPEEHREVLQDLLDAIDPKTDEETQLELMTEMLRDPEVAVAAAVTLLATVVKLLHEDGSGRGQQLLAKLREGVDG